MWLSSPSACLWENEHLSHHQPDSWIHPYPSPHLKSNLVLHPISHCTQVKSEKESKETLFAYSHSPCYSQEPLVNNSHPGKQQKRITFCLDPSPQLRIWAAEIACQGRFLAETGTTYHFDSLQTRPDLRTAYAVFTWRAKVQMEKPLQNSSPVQKNSKL